MNYLQTKRKYNGIYIRAGTRLDNFYGTSY